MESSRNIDVDIFPFFFFRKSFSAWIYLNIIKHYEFEKSVDLKHKIPEVLTMYFSN